MEEIQKGEEAELERRIERHVDAIEWYIEHPEAPLSPNLRAFVESMGKKVEEELRKTETVEAVHAVA